MTRYAALLFALALIAACSEDAPPPPSNPLPFKAPVTVEEDPPTEAPKAAAEELIAVRRYERLLNGRREGTAEVRWSWVEHEGRRVVKDVTVFRTRVARLMGSVRDSFPSQTVSTTLREATGELISMETITEVPGRTDRSLLRRTADGYAFENTVGENRESFTVETDVRAQVDAETLLGPKIRAGEAKPGTKWQLPLFMAGRRAVVPFLLEVIGPDAEGPGLKVRETFEGHVTLWWFSDDGSVVRVRSGNHITRRDDSIVVTDLPRRAAAFRITLASDRNLPRLFTGRSMIVDVEVEVDETVKPPQIPDNPFTKVVKATDTAVRLELVSHDDPKATAVLPLKTEGLEEFLKATPLMEVDHPELKSTAKRIVGAETDARLAARKIAEHVFASLRKGSTDVMQPTALQIHRDPRGDCSEHALYFTALCRAAGIPARRCRGYVCIGSDWGGHAWCEIWLGKWIGADPTTNEIGTRARYIYLGELDDPNARAASLTAERTKIRVRRAQYVDGTLDFEKGELDPVVFNGIRTAKPGEGWSVTHRGSSARINGPGLVATLQIQPDHGTFRNLTPAHARGSRVRFLKFGPRPALLRSWGKQQMLYVSLGREVLTIRVQATGETTPSLDALATLLAPTLERDA